MLNSSGNIDISAHNGPCADGGSKFDNRIFSHIGAAAAMQAEYEHLGHNDVAAIFEASVKAFKRYLQARKEPSSLRVLANSVGEKSTTICRMCKKSFHASANLLNDVLSKEGYVYPVRCLGCNLRRRQQAAAAEAARSGEASPGLPVSSSGRHHPSKTQRAALKAAAAAAKTSSGEAPPVISEVVAAAAAVVVTAAVEQPMLPTAKPAVEVKTARKKSQKYQDMSMPDFEKFLASLVREHDYIAGCVEFEGLVEATELNGARGYDVDKSVVVGHLKVLVPLAAGGVETKHVLAKNMRRFPQCKKLDVSARADEVMKDFMKIEPWDGS